MRYKHLVYKAGGRFMLSCNKFAPMKFVLRLLLCLFVLNQSNLVYSQVKQFTTITFLNPSDFYSEMLFYPSREIIDVREYALYCKSRIPGAVSADTPEKVKSLSDTLDRDIPFFVYSENGDESTEACLILLGKGFKNVFELKDGIRGWERQGFKVDNKKISKRRKKRF